MTASEWQRLFDKWGDLGCSNQSALIADLAACEKERDEMADKMRPYSHETVTAIVKEREELRDRAEKAEARVKVLEEALREMCESLVCQCDEAYTGRRLHAPDCTKWLGDIGRAALAGKEEKHDLK